MNKQELEKFEEQYYQLVEVYNYIQQQRSESPWNLNNSFELRTELNCLVSDRRSTLLKYEDFMQNHYSPSKDRYTSWSQLPEKERKKQEEMGFTFKLIGISKISEDILTNLIKEEQMELIIKFHDKLKIKLTEMAGILKHYYEQRAKSMQITIDKVKIVPESKG